MGGVLEKLNPLVRANARGALEGSAESGGENKFGAWKEGRSQLFSVLRRITRTTEVQWDLLKQLPSLKLTVRT